MCANPSSFFGELSVSRILGCEGRRRSEGNRVVLKFLNGLVPVGGILGVPRVLTVMEEGLRGGDGFVF